MILELYSPELFNIPKKPKRIKPKVLKRRERQEQLLKMFPDTPCYWEIKKDDRFYVKSFNGNTGRWQVSIYTPESFSRYKQFSNQSEDYSYNLEKE